MQPAISINVIRPQRLLHDGLVTSATKVPDKTALIIEGKSYTYSELYDAARRLAQALIKQGLQRGDRVAIYMDNTWPCVVSIFATLLAGGVFLVVNPQTKADKLEYILDDSEAKILLSDSHLTSVFAEAVKNTKFLIAMVLSGKFIEFDKPVAMTLASFDEVLVWCEPLAQPRGIIPNDLAALIYTSGSTGFPKGVMQTHQAMVFAAWSLIEYLRLAAHDKILLVLPIAFDYGLYQLLMTMKLGATLVIERSFTFPAQIYQRITEFGVTVFPAVPTIYAMMISSHKKKKLCFPSITRITNTAAALPADFIPYLQEIFPNALIYKMYGLTECKRVSYLEPELVNLKPTSVGKAIPGTEVYLQSPDGDPVTAGNIGILYVRGPHVMVGYWKQPELTEKMLKPGKLPGERVLCTHDWFRMDEEGYLYFVGRNDDIIKTRGEKVSPIEVENTLHSIDGVKEAAVIGVPDDVFGQAIRAFVVLETDAGLTDKMIKKICLMKLENFMVPRDVIILDEFLRSPNGKIDKKYLMEIKFDDKPSFV
jgi:long-chain acyl-CoA synthetase